MSISYAKITIFERDFFSLVDIQIDQPFQIKDFKKYLLISSKALKVTVSQIVTNLKISSEWNL